MCYIITCTGNGFFKRYQKNINQVLLASSLGEIELKYVWEGPDRIQGNKQTWVSRKRPHNISQKNELFPILPCFAYETRSGDSRTTSNRSLWCWKATADLFNKSLPFSEFHYFKCLSYLISTATNILNWKFSFIFNFLGVERTITKIHCLLGTKGPLNTVLFKMKYKAKCGILNKDLKVAANNFKLSIFDGIWQYHSE